jgi:hypothetical protein
VRGKWGGRRELALRHQHRDLAALRCWGRGRGGAAERGGVGSRGRGVMRCLRPAIKLVRREKRWYGEGEIKRRREKERDAGVGHANSPSHRDLAALGRGGRGRRIKGESGVEGAGCNEMYPPCDK